MKKIGPVEIGKETYIDDDVLLGYPGKDHIHVLIDGHKDNLHPTKIGNGVILRDKTVIYAGAVLENCVQTGHHVLIREGCIIGKGTMIGSGSIIEADCTIGMDVSIQSGVYLSNGTKVGDQVFIGTMVCVINDRMMDSTIHPVEIKKGARIGANSTLMAGITIEESAVIGAGSVVTKDVKKGAKVYGVPARDRK